MVTREADLAMVHRAIDSCSVCAAFAGPTFVKIVGLRRGGPAPIVIIGQGPGRKESENKQAFAGPAGTVLDRWLVASGADASNPRERLYLTSLIKCGCALTSEYWRMVGNCDHFLVSQLTLIRPSLVITLGRYAYEWIREDQLSYDRAVCANLQVGLNPLLARFDFAFEVLPWPHPSPANNAMLTRPDIQLRMRESFEIVRRHLYHP